MSISESGIRIINTQLNNSLSKQMYTFPKASRFMRNKQTLVTEYTANFTSFRRGRSTNFGYGEKIDLSKSFQGITSKFYDIPSCFKKQPSKTSFGKSSRNSIEKIYNKERKRIDNSLPGPGTYNLIKPINNNSKKFSIGSRLKRNYSSNDVTNEPGPGSYSLNSINIKSSTNYPLSTYKNSLVSSFGKSKSIRFDYYKGK